MRCPYILEIFELVLGLEFELEQTEIKCHSVKKLYTRTYFYKYKAKHVKC